MRVVAYDQSSLVLTVDLANGMRYEYFDVPTSLVEAMRSANSPEKFFNTEIWNAGFEYSPSWRELDSLLRYFEEPVGLFISPVTVHSRRGDDDTPLHVACVWGDIAAVDLLLRGGADPNARGDLGCTPIYNAVSFGHWRCAQRLIDAGATLDDANELNITARDVARRSNEPQVSALSNAA